MPSNFLSSALSNSLLGGALAVWLLALMFLFLKRGRSTSRPMRSRALELLRVFLPSWRFFDELGLAPRLFYRVSVSPDSYSPWQPCLEAPARPARAFVFNPEGNLHFASHSLLERLIQEVNEESEGNENEIAQSVTYRLVVQLVRFHINERRDWEKFDGHERNIARPLPLKYPLNFQFKLCAIVPRENGSVESHDILISLEHDCGHGPGHGHGFGLGTGCKRAESDESQEHSKWAESQKQSKSAESPTL